MKKKSPASTRFSLVKALSWIVCSAILVSGSVYSGANFYLRWQKKKELDPRNRLMAIVQTGPQKEVLHSSYLAELLDLSLDRPQSFHTFNSKAAAEKLLRSPVIKEAQVEVIKPGTVYVDYAVRQPVAWLYDYENAAIDEEGYFFPIHPFFSPKKLPEVYLGLQEDQEISREWNRPIQGKKIELALHLLQLLSSPSYRDYFPVKRIDVSHAYAESYGIREIVIITEEEIIQQNAGRSTVFVVPYILRLSTKNHAQELGNYLKLREQLLVQAAALCPSLYQPPQAEAEEQRIKVPGKIIDLRLSQLAFIGDMKSS